MKKSLTMLILQEMYNIIVKIIYQPEIGKCTLLDIYHIGVIFADKYC